jgi:hypothetical protein
VQAALPDHRRIEGLKGGGRLLCGFDLHRSSLSLYLREVKTPQSRAELLQHLSEQVGFLRSSAMMFDAGDLAESKRLAHTLRLLFHRTGMSHALLDQLGILDTMKLLDSAGDLDPLNMTTSCTLTSIRLSVDKDNPVDYVARLGSFSPQIAAGPIEAEAAIRFLASEGRCRMYAGQWHRFGDWWDVERVVKDDRGEVFTRHDLVKDVANMDGGSHVGPNLKDRYARLSRMNSLAGTVTANGRSFTPGNPVPAAIRQIAYEVDTSLCHYLPQLGPIVDPPSF